ncbi:DUF2218 domain-containing protein [Nocardia sp. NBC_01388]|uniref:DUF2218 domain-containing protein n=1 Tax=Nocardia sp. NBC_01388 TaxID=2903596 RepID=UPI0032500F33
MPTIEARIATDQSGRYLRRFGKHASAMASPRAHRMRMHGSNPIARGEVRLRIESTGALTTIHFDPWGRCALRAETDALVARIDASDDRAMQQIRDTITRDLERFGPGELAVDWHEVDGSAATDAEVSP